MVLFALAFLVYTVLFFRLDNCLEKAKRGLEKRRFEGNGNQKEKNLEHNEGLAVLCDRHFWRSGHVF